MTTCTLMRSIDISREPQIRKVGLAAKKRSAPWLHVARTSDQAVPELALRNIRGTLVRITVMCGCTARESGGMQRASKAGNEWGSDAIKARMERQRGIERWKKRGRGRWKKRDRERARGDRETERYWQSRIPTSSYLTRNPLRIKLCLTSGCRLWTCIPHTIQEAATDAVQDIERLEILTAWWLVTGSDFWARLRKS